MKKVRYGVSRALDLVRGCVEHNGGRVFNTAGDAILAEFPSAVGGLRVAMEARASLASAPGLAPDTMRFGLHVADVVALGEDLRGDGVNLAARLQAGADPGCIDVSVNLHDHVRRVSPCQFDDLGEKRFKGVSEPIRVMRVRASVDRHLYLSAPTVAHPVCEKHPNSVAVLPFRTASSADDDQTFLAEGLSEDIIHELSLCKSLFVSSRTASDALVSRDPVEIGAALGGRYVLSGSVRKMGTRVRMSLSLSDTSDGRVVWSERIQRPFDEVFEVMEEITAHVAATVSGRIDNAEIGAVRMKRPENMTAYEYYLRGLERHRLAGVSETHAREAIEWFQRAQKADPGFARPMAMEVCAASYLPEFDSGAAEKLLSHALEMDAADPELHRIMGIVQIKRHEDFEASRRHHEAAVELDPFLPVWVVEERIAALYLLERYADLSRAARSLAFQTRRTRIYRAAARVAIGDIDRARALIAEALADSPDLSTEYIVSQELYRDRDVLRMLIDRARKAGLPGMAVRRVAARGPVAVH